jgi:steroid delta-isomerase-like uncharacterized protein
MATAAEIVRRLTDEVFVGGDLSVIDELVAEDFVSHDPPPGMTPDRAGMRQIAAAVGQAFSDRKMEFDDFVDTTDGRVVESWAMVSNHTGEFFGVPASGRAVRLRGMEIWRCRDGQVVEHTGVVDMSDVFAPGPDVD